jgi:hypothetical protein
MLPQPLPLARKNRPSFRDPAARARLDLRNFRGLEFFSDEAYAFLARVSAFGVEAPLTLVRVLANLGAGVLVGSIPLFGDTSSSPTASGRDWPS